MEKLTPEEIKETIYNYKESHGLKKLTEFKRYYLGKNEEIDKRYKDRNRRGKTPNNLIPTAYYTSVVDSMAGYMFNDVVYKSDGDYEQVLNDLLSDNNVDVKDMASGVEGLAYNKSIEIVYGLGDEAGVEIKLSKLPVTQVIPLYTDDIEPVVYGAIWFRGKGKEELIDVIYADEWQYYTVKDDKIVLRDEPKELFFSECPVVFYTTQVIGKRPPFEQIIKYVDALDILLSGNSNEIDRLVDALLVLGKAIKPEDLEHMEEMKALQGMKKDDRAEYLTKDMSPSFREYVSNLLIQEIHKHSHVVDWYNPDTGLSGATSGKALMTRLFDMKMYSNRIEKIYRDGTEKRIRLIQEMQEKLGVKTEPVKIVFNRDGITDFETKVQALNNATYLSNQTKIEESGFSYTEEKERLEKESEERQENMPSFETEPAKKKEVTED